MGKDQVKQERWTGSDLFQRQPSQRHTMWCKSIVKPKNLKITHAAVCPPFCCFDYAVLCKSRPGRLHQAMNLTHKDIGLVVQKSSGARMQKKMFNLRMFFGAFVGIGLGFWLHCVLLVLAMKYYTTAAPSRGRGPMRLQQTIDLPTGLSGYHPYISYIMNIIWEAGPALR